MGEEKKRHFPHWKTNRRLRDLGKCSLYFIIREMQSKITIRYYHVPMRMVYLKKSRDRLYIWECGGEGIFTHFNFHKSIMKQIPSNT